MVVVELGATVWTRRAGIAMKKGERFFIRSHVVTATGGKYPTGLTLIDNVNQEGKMDGDLTAGTWVRATQTVFGFSPLIITGIPTTSNANFKVLGIWGDSISQGAGTTLASIDGNLAGEFGMLQNGAKRAGWGYASMGTNGQKASDFADLAKRINRMNFFKYCDSVIVEYGTNDLPDSAMTLAKLKDNLKLIHKLFWDMGIPTVQTTVVPRTTSTDAWATYYSKPNACTCKYSRWIVEHT